MNAKFRLGVDAGGTFTDFVLSKGDGTIKLYKTPSTPNQPTEAIASGLKLISDDTGLSASEVVANSDLCINGTTVALNALLQHKGAKVGLICTAGHQDSVEIRLGHKEEGHRYDAEYPPAKMLVPRHLRRPVRERVLSTGDVREPLNEHDVVAAVEYFKEHGVEAVAISFLWSVLNPVHERRAAEIVRSMMPDVFVTPGTEIFPQMREYTRTSTVVVNAYLGPILARYVDTLDGYFDELGARQPPRYFQSNGGLSIGKSLVNRAVYAINSGPAAGPAAGTFVAEPFGIKNIITVDMGGTSFDITLTRDGHTNIQKGEDFLRYRLGVPMLHVETLGAGGGSIGYIDELGILSVGPQSAGAVPGPVCYGRGGRLPTVTDCNLLLGYLSPEGLLGGRLSLDVDGARAAVREELAEPLGMSVEDAALGVHQIVNNNMVNGIRRVSIEKGLDPRDFALVSAGGAGSMHIISLAQEIGIDTVLVPRLASGLCAFGQIISDAKYNFLATKPTRLNDNVNYDDLNKTFRSMEAEGIDLLKSDGFTKTSIKIKRTVYMRYIDQIHEIAVSIPYMELSSNNIDQVKDLFHDAHERHYTYAERRNLVEIVDLESTVIGVIDKPGLSKNGRQNGARHKEATQVRKVYHDGEWYDTPVFDGQVLDAHTQIKGPAIIEEETTSILLTPGWSASLHDSDTYLLQPAT